MISVIIPLYNVEQYLSDCIESVLAQTYTDFELILVDDGSTDNCGAICDAYKRRDKRVVVVHQNNQGVASTRNTGIALAKGEYIAFVDSDDIVHADYLNSLYHALQKSRADISVCDMQRFAEENELKHINTYTKRTPRLMTGRDGCLSIYHMDGKVPVMAWGKLYRAELFENIRYPIGMIHEDDATTPKLLYRARKIVLMDDKLYYYRQRAGSIMDIVSRKVGPDGIKAVDGCTLFFEEENDYELAQLTKRFKKVVHATRIVTAYKNDAHPAISEQYKMSLWKALRIIRKHTGTNTYTWYLSLVYPKLVKPYSYIVKIKQMLGIKGNIS